VSKKERIVSDWKGLKTANTAPLARALPKTTPKTTLRPMDESTQEEKPENWAG